MTTTITGDETETPDTNTNTLSGGLTNGQIVRALFGNGLELNSAGEIVVKNAQQVGGQTPRDLLGAFSFSGEAMRGNGGGNVLTARTDASGDRTKLALNPGGDYPNGTDLHGDINLKGVLNTGMDGAAFEPPFILDATTKRRARRTAFQVRAGQGATPTPLFKVEHRRGARTSTLNGTLAVGYDESGRTNPDVTGTAVEFGGEAALYGTAGGGLAVVDKNGNRKTLI